MWLLEALNLPYEVEIVKRNKQTSLAPPELENIHPLGKSPTLVVTPPGEGAKPIVLAESGFITQYLCDHYGQNNGLVPKKWKDGMEGKLGGETDDWMRFQYILHYCEGSLMPILVLTLILSRKLGSGQNSPRRRRERDELIHPVVGINGPSVPFFIRPITSGIVSKINASYLFPNAKKHLSLVDEMLSQSGGDYICGSKLTAADILMCFPLIAGWKGFEEMGVWDVEGKAAKTYPRVYEYRQRLLMDEGYLKAEKKLEELEAQSDQAVKAKH